MPSRECWNPHSIGDPLLEVMEMAMQTMNHQAIGMPIAIVETVYRLRNGRTLEAPSDRVEFVTLTHLLASHFLGGCTRSLDLLLGVRPRVKPL